MATNEITRHTLSVLVQCRECRQNRSREHLLSRQRVYIHLHRAGACRQVQSLEDLWMQLACMAHDSYEVELARVDKALAEELKNDANLTADERKQLENIKS